MRQRPYGALVRRLPALALSAAGIFAAFEVEGQSDRAEPTTTTCGPIDLVLAIDATGSMRPAIKAVRQRARALLDLVDRVSGGQFQLGLVTFRDRVIVDLDLSDQPDPATRKRLFIERLGAIKAEAGLNEPEASDEAINTVIHGLAAAGRPQKGDFSGRFRGASRIVVLMTDQLPGGFDDRFTKGLDDRHVVELAEAARDAGINISVVNTGPLWFGAKEDELTTLLKRYAEISGGIYQDARPYGERADTAILEIVSACGRPSVS